MRNSQLDGNVGAARIKSFGDNSRLTVSGSELEGDSDAEIQTEGSNSSILATNNMLESPSARVEIDTLTADSKIVAFRNTFTTGGDDAVIMAAGTTVAKRNDFTGVGGAVTISGAGGCTVAQNTPAQVCT